MDCIRFCPYRDLQYSFDTEQNKREVHTGYCAYKQAGVYFHVLFMEQKQLAHTRVPGRLDSIP